MSLPICFLARCVRGLGRGADLGFATINLDAAAPVPAGVYAARARVAGRWHLAALHAGPRPTFADAPPSVELHLLDFLGAVPTGTRVAVEVVARLRGVQKFASQAELATAIAADVAAVRGLLLGAASCENAGSASP